MQGVIKWLVNLDWSGWIILPSLVSVKKIKFYFIFLKQRLISRFRWGEQLFYIKSNVKLKKVSLDNYLKPPWLGNIVAWQFIVSLFLPRWANIRKLCFPSINHTWNVPEFYRGAFFHLGSNFWGKCSYNWANRKASFGRVTTCIPNAGAPMGAKGAIFPRPLVCRGPLRLFSE